MPLIRHTDATGATDNGGLVSWGEVTAGSGYHKKLFVQNIASRTITVSGYIVQDATQVGLEDYLELTLDSGLTRTIPAPFNLRLVEIVPSGGGLLAGATYEYAVSEGEEEAWSGDYPIGTSPSYPYLYVSGIVVDGSTAVIEWEQAARPVYESRDDGSGGSAWRTTVSGGPYLIWRRALGGSFTSGRIGYCAYTQNYWGGALVLLVGTSGGGVGFGDSSYIFSQDLTRPQVIRIWDKAPLTSDMTNVFNDMLTVFPTTNMTSATGGPNYSAELIMTSGWARAVEIGTLKPGEARVYWARVGIPQTPESGGATSAYVRWAVS